MADRCWTCRLTPRSPPRDRKVSLVTSRSAEPHTGPTGRGRGQGDARGRDRRATQSESSSTRPKSTPPSTVHLPYSPVPHHE